MQHARNGRDGLLQEGNRGREQHAGSFNRAFMLRSQLFSEWNHWLYQVSASAPVNKPSHSDSSIIYPIASRDIALISPFKLG
jgi:hypothetical protein